MKPRPPTRKYACAPTSAIGSKVQTGITALRQGVGRVGGTIGSPLGNTGTVKGAATRAQFSKLKPMNVRTKKDFLLSKKLSTSATQKIRHVTNKKGR